MDNQMDNLQRKKSDDKNNNCKKLRIQWIECKQTLIKTHSIYPNVLSAYHQHQKCQEIHKKYIDNCTNKSNKKKSFYCSILATH